MDEEERRVAEKEERKRNRENGECGLYPLQKGKENGECGLYPLPKENGDGKKVGRQSTSDEGCGDKEISTCAREMGLPVRAGERDGKILAVFGGDREGQREHKGDVLGRSMLGPEDSDGGDLGGGPGGPKVIPQESKGTAGGVPASCVERRNFCCSRGGTGRGASCDKNQLDNCPKMRGCDSTGYRRYCHNDRIESSCNNGEEGEGDCGNTTLLITLSTEAKGDTRAAEMEGEKKEGREEVLVHGKQLGEAKGSFRRASEGCASANQSRIGTALNSPGRFAATSHDLPATNSDSVFEAQVLGHVGEVFGMGGSVDRKSNNDHSSGNVTVLPLHVKDVPKFMLDEAKVWCAQQGGERNWDYYRQHFSHNLLKKIPRVLGKGEAAADLEKGDIQKLLAFGLVRKVQSHEKPQRYVKIFTLVEKEKNRRRLIAHTTDINDALELDEEFKISLPGLEDIIEDVLEFSYAAVTDFAAYYHSFGLTAEEQMHYCFVDKGSGDTFCLLTIPTGQRHCVGLAQCLTEGIIHCAKMAVPSGRWRGFIDNVKYNTNSKAEGDRAMQHIEMLTHAAHIKLNMHETMVSEEVVFLGIHCDHKKKAISLSERKVQKAKRLLEGLQRDDLPLREALSIFSFCISASRILDIPLYPKYPIFKFFRRRHLPRGDNKKKEIKKALAEPARLWNCIRKIWNIWLQEIIDNKPRDLRRRKLASPYKLYTDASKRGWGSIIFRGNEIQTACGRWAGPVPGWPIHELEAHAVVRAVKNLKLSKEERQKTELFVDNTSILSTLHKRRSKSFYFNRLVEKIQCYQFYSYNYVPTADNPADFYSRL